MMEEKVLTPKIKINKKELILEEAAKLFKEKGFGGTSMRDLAEKVGMEAASMYNHIKSKDEILELICFKIANQYISQLQEIENTNQSFQDKLKAIIGLHVQLIIEDSASVSVANRARNGKRRIQKNECFCSTVHNVIFLKVDRIMVQTKPRNHPTGIGRRFENIINEWFE